MSTGFKYLQIQQPTWAVFLSFVCFFFFLFPVRAVRWWQQQQWCWNWGLLWGEKSPQREPLVSRRDKSFTMPVCRKLPQESRRAVCCSRTFDWKRKSGGTARADPEFVSKKKNETRGGGQAEDVSFAEIGRSLWRDSVCRTKSLERYAKCERCCPRVKQSGRSNSGLDSVGRGLRVGDGGGTSGHFRRRRVKEKRGARMASALVYTSYPF